MAAGKTAPRLFLSATAILAVAGLYGGLERLGAPIAATHAAADLHGLLMMQGVFGTLVPLERCVALGRQGWFAAPFLSAAGMTAIQLGAPLALGAAMLLASAILFTIMSAHVLRLQPASFNLSLLLGAAALLAGTATWCLGGDGEQAMPFWLAFLLLTVAGERLELGRFLQLPPLAIRLYFIIAAAVLAGATPFGGDLGHALFGLGLLALAAWLLRYDIARRTIHSRGQTRFMAAAILCGHFWLGASGLAFMLEPILPVLHDLAIHGTTIGFAMSMVMGHALIILPAVAGLRPRYSPALYLPLALLHASVVARVILALAAPDSLWLSGTATVAAFGLFAVLLIGVRSPQHC